MMKDALSGKIDMIVTKSVSRFARNLIDCISWVRRLKEQDPPIPVLFEQENLNTLDSTSNIILFVLAMVVEEESHMKSEAMLLSLEWRFSRGRFMTTKLLGYDKVEVVENGIHRKKLYFHPAAAKYRGLFEGDMRHLRMPLPVLQFAVSIQTAKTGVSGGFLVT